MLLRFTLENHRSFREEQELSLVASKLKGPNGYLLRTNSEGIEVVPAAVIYGANASGKTNLLDGLQFMRSAVLFSHARGAPGAGVPRSPFLLSAVSQDEPSKFSIDFVAHGIRYHYGFEATDSSFTSEWLYSFPSGKQRRIFERRGQNVEFGPSFKGPKKSIVEFMRENSLFLSTATQNDNEALLPIIEFFRKLAYSSSIQVSKNTISRVYKEEDIDERSIRFLTKIGSGVDGFRKTEVDADERTMLIAKEIFAVVSTHSGDKFNEEDFIKNTGRDIRVELSHSGESGVSCFLPIEAESSGTRRLLVLLSKIFRVLDTGGVALIDELDASLHTLAAEAVVALFSSKETNPNAAQLIATTHDTNLMRSNFLRRDQIWLSEKSHVGSTVLYPLSEIRARRQDDFEKGYLQGRYGAVPFSGDALKLFED